MTLADPTAPMAVTVLVRSADDDGLARPADLQRVRTFARNHALAVASVHAGRHTVGLAGTAGAMSRAFHVELRAFEDPELGTLRVPAGHVCVPASLEAVSGVFGL